VQVTKLTTELALEDAGLDWGKVSRVVLVGGSTHMPAVRQMLKDISRMTPDTGVNPVIAVALGAAIYAHMLETGSAPKAIHQKEPIAPNPGTGTAPPAIVAPAETLPAPTGALPRVRFVTAHGVGVKALSKGKWINAVLIPKNTPVPCSVSKRFYSVKSASGNTAVKIVVTQGDTPHLELAETLGVGRIEGLPAGDHSGQPVEVTMRFDEQGRVHMDAVYVNTAQRLRLSLEIPSALRAEQVREYRQLLKETGLTGGKSPKKTNGDEIVELRPIDDD
jgi:molecular chaperone DnaK